MLRLAPSLAQTRTGLKCFTSTSGAPTGDQLRTQIDQLRAEADTARAKGWQRAPQPGPTCQLNAVFVGLSNIPFPLASTARMRLMRLSEAAERLRRQAAVYVQSGRENDARDLLFQKKKVMQALDKSRSRIQWLDELSAKLNQAISVKESQLIVNIASNVNANGEDASGPVRIVPPSMGGVDDCDDRKDFVPDSLMLVNSQNLPSSTENESSQWEGLECYGADVNDTFSYDDFLEHIDEQLNKIEAELVNVLDVSTLILNDDEKSRNSRVNEIGELLEDIRAIRQRLSRVVPIKVETN